MVWWQDFPLSKNSQSSVIEERSEFYTELVKILRAMQVPDPIVVALGDYDFSLAKGRLVASVPGKFTQNQLYDHGHLRLSKIVQEISPSRSDQERIVWCQTSSMGATQSKWAREFYRSACGLAPLVVPPRTRNAPQDETLPLLRFVFPSEKTVRTSLRGPAGGGTIHFNSRYWLKFPQSLMRDCISVRSGVLMHSKVLSHLFTLKDNTLSPTRANAAIALEPRYAHPIIEIVRGAIWELDLCGIAQCNSVCMGKYHSLSIYRRTATVHEQLGVGNRVLYSGR